MVVIDTDVLLLAFAFHNDPRQAANFSFLQTVQASTPAITIYTLMEILGKLSFNLSPERLADWQSWLAERTPGVEHFVTWNARHFKGKTSLEVMTPEGYLQI